MKTFSNLIQELNESPIEVTPNDVYEYARHVADHAKAHKLVHYPMENDEWGTTKHKKAFMNNTLDYRSHEYALKHLIRHHQAKGVFPRNIDPDIGRKAWHHAAKIEVNQNPDWAKKKNEFIHRDGKSKTFLSKHENVEAGSSTKGLISTMKGKNIHPGEIKKYIDLDHQCTKKFVGGYKSYSRENLH